MFKKLFIFTCILLLSLASVSKADVVAQYSMENNVDDSSGNGIDGTIIGGPTFVSGQIDQALS